MDATPPTRQSSRFGLLAICLLPAGAAASGLWAGFYLLRSNDRFIATCGGIVIVGSLVGAAGTLVMTGAVLFGGGRNRK